MQQQQQMLAALHRPRRQTAPHCTSRPPPPTLPPAPTRPRSAVPMVDRTPSEPPPYTVLVQGPPGVGKTTLIRGLIKHYTRQDVREVKGPITLIAGKQRRLTFVECPQGLSAMIDAAKYADLVLLLIDGGFGFEMETFEFLNLLQVCGVRGGGGGGGSVGRQAAGGAGDAPQSCQGWATLRSSRPMTVVPVPPPSSPPPPPPPPPPQVHGFPKVMGVLTHLDGFRDSKALKKTKKALKHRFWTEIYQGGWGRGWGRGPTGADLGFLKWRKRGGTASGTMGPHYGCRRRYRRCRGQALLPERRAQRQVHEAGGAQPG